MWTTHGDVVLFITATILVACGSAGDAWAGTARVADSTSAASKKWKKRDIEAPP